MSDISLFDEPPRVTISVDWVSSRNGLLVGIAVVEGSTIAGLVCLEDGNLTLMEASGFTLDWRYNVETDQWDDQNNQVG